MDNVDKVDLSVIVTVVGGPTYLRNCLDKLIPQAQHRIVEVLVPYQSGTEGLKELIQKYPQVSFIEIKSGSSVDNYKNYTKKHEIYDRGKSLGILTSRGELIAFLDDQGVPAPNWCEEIFAANINSYGAVGGAIEQHGLEIVRTSFSEARSTRELLQGM